MLTQNEKEKYLYVGFFVLFLVLIGLIIYFAIKANKKCTGEDTPETSPPTLKGFNVQSTSWPWTTATWYKYSYVDKQTSKEGNQSAESSSVKSTTGTNPIIKLDDRYLNTYNVKVYRSTTTVDGTYSQIQVTINSDGTFVDTDNPSPSPPEKPPTPSSPPSLSGWQGGGVEPEGPGCPSGSTKCSSSYCTSEQIGKCTNSDSPWSCYDGSGGCATNANTLEKATGCLQYCHVQH